MRATGCSLEFDPGRRDAVGFVGCLGGPESRRIGVVETLGEHVGNLLATFDGLDVPGERHQVSPEAVECKFACHTLDVTSREGRLEIRQPGVDAFLRCHRRQLHLGGDCGIDGLRHHFSLFVNVTHSTSHKWPRSQALQSVAISGRGAAARYRLPAPMCGQPTHPSVGLNLPSPSD